MKTNGETLRRKKALNLKTKNHLKRSVSFQKERMILKINFD
jgi:hypothetical protein